MQAPTALKDKSEGLSWEDYLVLPPEQRVPWELEGVVAHLPGDADCYSTVESQDKNREDLHDALEALDGRQVRVTIEVLD
jgi:hypothetical protein